MAPPASTSWSACRPAVPDARSELLRQFRWIDGHADIWAAFRHGPTFAAQLGIGFVAVRKSGALFPGDKLARRTEPDYRANTTELLLQRAALTEGGAELVGCAVLVDQLIDTVRDQLPPVRAVLRGAELPPTE